MILDARWLLQTQAAQEVEAARLGETKRRNEEAAIRFALDAALDAWTHYIESGRLDPGQLGMLASAIDAQTAALRTAEASTVAAVRTTELRQADYALCHVQASLAETLHRRTMREAGRQAERRALDANDDRLAIQWGRQ